jgi:hypothetical protein
VRSPAVDEVEALRALSLLIEQFGPARTVSWIADILQERSDTLLVASDHRNAAESMRMFRIVQTAALRLRD